MSKISNSKQYDLEERTFKFAKNVRKFVKRLPMTLVNIEDSKQLIKASGPIGANYIEANEALGKKDFLMRIKICKKEAKESGYWLRLIKINNSELLAKQKTLIQETSELMKIFGSILEKSK